MASSKSRLAYPDCQQFLDAALEDEKGVRLPFQTYGQAMQFRVRLNTYRQIIRDDNAIVYPDPAHHLHGRSEFDELQFTIMEDSEGEYWVYAKKQHLDIAEIEKLSEIGD